MVVNDNVLMRMLSVTYNTHTHKQNYIYVTQAQVSDLIWCSGTQ